MLDVVWPCLLDAMAIRKHVCFDAKMQRMIGFVDLGDDVDDETDATEALVLMVVGLSGHWKAPVVYNFTLTCDVQAHLIKHVVDALAEINIKVCAITMDGHATYVAMSRQLGCVFDSTSQTSHPFFKHPLTGCDVYVIFDPCLIHATNCPENISEAGYKCAHTGVHAVSELLQLHLFLLHGISLQHAHLIRLTRCQGGTVVGLSAVLPSSCDQQQDVGSSTGGLGSKA